MAKVITDLSGFIPVQPKKSEPTRRRNFVPTAKDNLQAQVLSAFQAAGFSLAGAQVLAAEVGRENDFNPKFIFGVHSDPKNARTNMGIFSWQKDRKDKLQAFLRTRGLLQEDGSIKPGFESIKAQAEFAATEMPKDIKAMLQQPRVDYRTAVEAVGKKYIRWRFDDPKFAEGHVRRDRHFQALTGIKPEPVSRAPAQATKAKPKIITDLSGFVPVTAPRTQPTAKSAAMVDAPEREVITDLSGFVPVTAGGK